MKPTCSCGGAVNACLESCLPLEPLAHSSRLLHKVWFRLFSFVAAKRHISWQGLHQSPAAEGSDLGCVRWGWEMIKVTDLGPFPELVLDWQEPWPWPALRRIEQVTLHDDTSPRRDLLLLASKH